MKVRRLPYSRTWKQEKKLDEEAALKALRDGQRTQRIKFIALITVFLVMYAGLFYITSLIPDAVYSSMDVIK